MPNQVWRGLRKVIYLVPSNTAVAIVTAAARRLPGETSGVTADISADAAQQPTGCDTAPSAYELTRAWLGTPTNSMTSQSARRSSATEAAEEEVSESEGAAEERREPSQEPSNAFGERDGEISEAATSRDGDGGTVFI